MKLSSVSAWFGSILLAATAAFHGTGYRSIAAAVDRGGLSGGLPEIIKALWIFVSYHWIFIALIAIVALRSRASRALLLLCAIVLAADALLLLLAVGPFIGEAMLAASAVSYGIAAATQKDSAA